MKRKYLAYGIVALVAIIGYNAFLIQRDQKLYDSYYCRTIGCANER